MANINSLDLELGSSQQLEITDAAQTGLDITGDLTIECWIKPESTTAEHTFVGKWEDGTGDYRCYLFRYVHGVTQLQFAVSSDGTTGNTTSGVVTYAISAGTWYHVAAVYDASAGEVDFYVNGAHQGSTATGMKTSIADTGAVVGIGCKNATGTPTHFYDGLIDEVRIWAEERSAANILANYKKELTGSETNLKAYWKLNGNYLDQTANNNDLTAINTPVFSTDVPFNDMGGSFLLNFV